MLPQHINTLADLVEGATFDVIVLGAGGAGMATALFAAKRGARVLLVESTAQLGGTTAFSAGTIWAPGSREGLQLNPEDSVDAARRYLDHVVGQRTTPALREAFLVHAADAIAALQEGTQVQLRARGSRPDYQSEAPGAAVKGRVLEPIAFDGRRLGADFHALRPPPREYTWLGGMMFKRQDMHHWQRWRRSFKSARHMAGLMGNMLRDRLTGHARATRLLRGNALVAQLLMSLREHQVTIITRTRVTTLRSQASDEAHRVDEAVLVHEGVSRRVRATQGMVLATGGFNRHPMQRAARMPNIDMDWCPGAPGHTGTAHTLAENLGAHYGTGAESPCVWAPVSLRTRRDGSQVAYPHFGLARASPRLLAVNALGQRFVNEATSPHQFALAMQSGVGDAEAIPAYLITDAEGVHRYGLGMVRPAGIGLAQAVADGYVVQAQSLRELADRLEIRAAPLTESVTHFNGYWAEGVDTRFHRGASVADQAEGDADWRGPNPSLGPINKAPFYALRLYPGDVAAVTGFVTDTRARVLDGQGKVVPGLYAVGDDMQSIMGGTDPAPGCSLGPALVFAYLAAQDLTQQKDANPEAGAGTQATT